MNHSEVKNLIDYHYWATERSLDAAAALTPEQYLRPLGNSFSSVRDTLVHIYSAEWVWFSRWNETSPQSMLDPASFPDLTSLRKTWREHESRVRGFFENLREDEVNKT